MKYYKQYMKDSDFQLFPIAELEFNMIKDNRENITVSWSSAHNGYIIVIY